MSKYKIFIPEHLRAYRPRPLRWLGKFLMKITGWKTTGHLPKDERVVLIAGPHTSNWDFVLAMSLILSLDVHIHWVGCLLYTSPSPRDQRGSRMPSSA